MTKEAQTPGQQEWKKWLGGLDSNQDNQIQNLMYCQLYDLPVAVNKAHTYILHMWISNLTPTLTQL
jgi:hypothetical protein